MQQIENQKNFVRNFSTVINMINLKIAAKLLKIRENNNSKFTDAHFPQEVMMLL